jgi:DNA polymerase
MLVEQMEYLDAESIELIYRYPMDVLAACVRPVVQARPGYMFLDVDLNAIENRVLGWLANCQKILRVFREGRCPYVDFATYMYKQPYDVLYHEYKVLKDKTKRTVAKPGVLGCGYMLSAGVEFENETTGEMEATGLLGYAWNMGVQLTHEQAKLSVDVFRGTFHEVPAYWKEIDRAARRTISTGRPHEAGPVTFDRSGPFLRMRLPSGRYLHYYNPRIENRRMPWGDMRPSIVYKGLNDKKQWVDTTTHPGKLTENADQAIARDLLGHGMLLARQEGLPIRFHVHDQIIAEVKEEHAERLLPVLEACMQDQPSWAKGLPLGAEGHIDRIFRKD